MRKVISIVTIFIFVLSLNLTLYSQQDSDIDKILKEGKEAYVNGNFKEAINKLSLAIRLIKNKEDLVEAYITLALTYFTLGEEKNSEESVKKALKIKPALVLSIDVYSPKFIAFVEDVKSKNLITILFKLSPSAKLYINDVFFKEGDEIKAKLFKGKHKIKVEKKGFEAFIEDVTFEKDGGSKEIKLTKILKKKKKKKKTPVSRTGRVEKEGKKKKKGSSLLLIIGGVVVVGVVAFLLLSKKKEEKIEEIKRGTLIVHSEPEGARVFLDGTDMGQNTPCQITNVEPGSHHIVVRLGFYGKWEHVFEIAPDQIMELGGRLSPFVYNYSFQIKYVDYPMGIDLNPSEDVIYVAAGSSIRGYNKVGTEIDRRPKNDSLDCTVGVYVKSLAEIFVTDHDRSNVMVFNVAGNMVRKWGAQGTQNSRFMEIGGIVGDSDGTIFVADGGNHRIQVFNSSGSFERKWGQQGDCDKCLEHPSDIAISPDGNLYVADSGLDRVIVFSKTGSFRHRWGAGLIGDSDFLAPTGIDIDKRGYVYVVSHVNNKVAKFTLEGEFMIYVAKGGGSGQGKFNEPYDVAVSEDGKVYVTDAANGRIQVFKISEEVQVKTVPNVKVRYKKVSSSRRGPVNRKKSSPINKTKREKKNKKAIEK